VIQKYGGNYILAFAGYPAGAPLVVGHDGGLNDQAAISSLIRGQCLSPSRPVSS
jgi:hypothetical protein